MLEDLVKWSKSSFTISLSLKRWYVRTSLTLNPDNGGLRNWLYWTCGIKPLWAPWGHCVSISDVCIALHYLPFSLSLEPSYPVHHILSQHRPNSPPLPAVQSADCPAITSWEHLWAPLCGCLSARERGFTAPAKSWEPDQPGPQHCSSSDKWLHKCSVLLTHCSFSARE